MKAGWVVESSVLRERRATNAGEILRLALAMLIVALAAGAAYAAPIYLATPVSDSGVGNTISSPNTSRTVAVGPDNTIYVAYHGTQGVRVTRSLDSGATFQPTVQLTTLNAQVEIAVDENNVVYAAWKSNGNAVISRSTDGGQTFSSPAVVGAASGSAVHMATDAPYVYVVPQSGSVLFVNSASGVGAFASHATGSSGVFTDVHADLATHKVYVLFDNGQLHYVISSDRGQTFAPAVTPGGATQFSATALSAGGADVYAFMGGIGSAGYRIDFSTGHSTAITVGDSGLATGRSLAADAAGDLVDGYCYNSHTYYRFSGDRGATFDSPVSVASSSAYTCVTINRRRSDIIAVFEQAGRIYASIYATGLVPQNRPPDAYAGPEIIVEQAGAAGTLVTLDGSASTDPDGDALTYTWMENGSAIAGPTTSAYSDVVLQLGVHAITLIVDDGNGGTDQADISLIVGDTMPPDMVLPLDVVAEATDAGGAQVNLGAPTVYDICDAAPLLTNDAPDCFPMGETSVIWTVSDASGNSTRMVQCVTVVDTTPPILAQPERAVTEQTCADGAGLALTTPAACDLCDPAPAVTCDAPAVFPLGTTLVTWTATDVSHNSACVTQTVIVQDTTAPTIHAPADTIAEQGNLAGTSVALGLPVVTDICDAAPEVCSNAPPALPLGTTTVIWTATDESGNCASAAQNVTVVDTTPPVLTLPGDMSVAKQDSSGAVVTFSVTARDLCDAAPQVQCNPPSGSRFPIGTTAVACVACDDSGNSATGAFNVTVSDNCPPTVRLSTQKTSLWPAFGVIVGVGLNLNVRDTCDRNPTVTMSVTQNEPVATGGRRLSARADAQIVTNRQGKITGLRLRSERANGGSGRVYLIIVKATNKYGQTTVRCCAVTVPLQNTRRSRAAVEAIAHAAVAAGVPLAYDSTGGQHSTR